MSPTSSMTRGLAAASRDERVRASLVRRPRASTTTPSHRRRAGSRAALVRALREIDAGTVADALEARARGAQRPSPIGPLAQVAAAGALDR